MPLSKHTFEENLLLVLSFIRGKPKRISHIRNKFNFNHKDWLRYLYEMIKQEHVTVSTSFSKGGKCTSKLICITENGRVYLKEKGIMY